MLKQSPMINEDVLDKVCVLSRLRLEKEEKVQILDQMSRIIDHFDKLKEVNTEGVEPLYKAVEMKNVWREDMVQTMTEPEVLMNQAPEQQEGQVKVPQVVK